MTGFPSTPRSSRRSRRSGEGGPPAGRHHRRRLRRACAAAVAAEIARILREETVRDKQTGVARGGDAGRHRHPVPFARQPSRVRERARGGRHPDLRLQGAGLLRRRRDQGSVRADPLPREPLVGSARGGIPAIAFRPPVGRRARGARPPSRRRFGGASARPRRGADLARAARRARRPGRRRPRGARAGAPSRARRGWPGSIACLRRT